LKLKIGRYTPNSCPKTWGAVVGSGNCLVVFHNLFSPFQSLFKLPNISIKLSPWSNESFVSFTPEVQKKRYCAANQLGFHCHLAMKTSDIALFKTNYKRIIAKEIFSFVGMKLDMEVIN